MSFSHGFIQRYAGVPLSRILSPGPIVRQPLPPPVSPFSVGTLIDHLPAHRPVVLVDCCEYILDWLSFGSSELATMNTEHQELLRLCERLPASLPHRPGLQRRLDDFQAEVSRMSRVEVASTERADAIVRLQDLCHRARRLLQDVEGARQAHDARLAAGQLSLQETPMLSGDGARPPGATPGQAVPVEQPALGAQRRPRRRDLADERALVEIRPAMARPAFALDAAQQEVLRTAVDRALGKTQRNEMLTGNEMRRLGHAIARVVGGSFPTLLPHSVDLRERRFPVIQVVRDATASMVPAHREVIRDFLEDYLRGQRAR